MGNPVGIGDGPAAVIGDERRRDATGPVRWIGKARLVERSESQKTCLHA